MEMTVVSKSISLYSAGDQISRYMTHHTRQNLQKRYPKNLEFLEFEFRKLNTIANWNFDHVITRLHFRSCGNSRVLRKERLRKTYFEVFIVFLSFWHNLIGVITNPHSTNNYGFRNTDCNSNGLSNTGNDSN